MEEIFTELISLSDGIIKIDPERVSLDSLIMEELGADSLDVAELLVRIEERYGIYIPDNEVIEMRTVGDVVRYLKANL